MNQAPTNKSHPNSLSEKSSLPSFSITPTSQEKTACPPFLLFQLFSLTKQVGLMNQAPTKKTVPNSLEIRTVSIKEKVACPLFLPFFLPLFLCMFSYYFKLSERDHMSLYSLI